MNDTFECLFFFFGWLSFCCQFTGAFLFLSFESLIGRSENVNVSQDLRCFFY